MELKTYFAQDRSGNLIPSATITIYLTGTNTLASGLVSVSGNPLSNPFTADADGKIQFRAPNGVYDMTVALGSTAGTRVTIQCVDIVQQMTDATAAAERAESAAKSAQGSATDAANGVGRRTFTVATEAAMLATAATLGDMAVRTDLKKSFILKAVDATKLGNWQEIITDALPRLAEVDGERLLGACPDIATLRNIEPKEQGQRITLRQHTAGTGLGGGQFRAVMNGSSHTDNNGTVIKTAGGAAWLRINADIVNPLMFGAVYDDKTDDTQAHKNMLAASFAMELPPGVAKITDTLRPRAGSIVRGAGKNNTRLRLYTNDVDLIQLDWYTTIDGFSLESMLPNLPEGQSYSRGLVRLQSTTHPEVPEATKPYGGLSYFNSIRNIALWSGQSYNLYGFGIGYTEWYNSDSLLPRGSSGVFFNGSDANVARGTTLFMHGVNRITACLGGDGFVMNNQFGMYIQGIFEGNRKRAITVYGTADNINIDGYFENNFALASGGTGHGDAIVCFETSVTRGCTVRGYYDTMNADNVLKVHAAATGFGNYARYFERELYQDFNQNPGFLNLAGSACRWDIDYGLAYYKEADLGQIRNGGKLTHEQCLTYSPYSIVRNPKFNAWSGALPDNWAQGSAVKGAGGYAGSDYRAVLNSYPATFLQQVDLHTRLERGVSNYHLVIVGRNGSTMSAASSGYNGSNRCLLTIGTSTGNLTLNIPELVFGTEWTMQKVHLEELLAGDFPNKANILGLTLTIHAKSGTEIGLAGLYDNSAGYFIPSDK